MIRKLSCFWFGHVTTNPIIVSGYGLTEYSVWFCKRCPKAFGIQTKNFNERP